MKAINKITSLFVLCLLLGFAACTEELKYDPAEIPGNAQIYFPNTLPSRIELSQDLNVKSYNIELRRIDKKDAITVNLSAVNENPSLFSIPTSASFAAGSESTTFTITYDPDALGYDNYRPLKITVSDESQTSPYGVSTYSFTAGIPAPWKSLGTGTFIDTYMFDDPYQIVVQQHMLDPTRYRLVDPFTKGLNAEGYVPNYTKGNQSPYWEFQILPKGSVYKGVTTTVNGLVVYNDIYTGYFHTTYQQEVLEMHPSRFTNYATENFWLHNIVTKFSATGEPEVIQFAPYVYMMGVGGWNYSQNDGVVTFIFPGVVLVEYDYSISLDYLGHYIDVNDVDNAIIKFTKGDDAASYKYAVVEGALSASAAVGVANEIIAGTIASEEDTQSGYKTFPLTAAGKYTVVAVTFDENGEDQDFSYVSFEFTPAGMSDPWVSLGFCKYTDDVLVPMYLDEEDDPLDYIPTYDVEIFENRDNPGLFRLKNAYGAGYPYNEPGDYVEGDVFIEINATDPNGVYIDMQSMGVNWGDGNVNIYSFASYYMDRGQTLEQVKAAGHCGTYKNKIITFPVNKLLVKFDGNTSLYYANSNEMWKVDMTSLRSSASKSSSLRSGLVRSFSPGKAPLKLNSIQPVRVESKNLPASVARKNIKVTEMNFVR